MAELTIRLRVDPQTGKKDVIISYEADDDAMPLEHEDEHKSLVDRLIEGGALKAAEVGKIIVERESRKGEAAALPVGETGEQRESEEQGQ
ncbi:MAG: hypothetical protein KC503_28260 [Myxococcales bacterium]|nr:hypothetical protein [Myxococcales bacterium]